MLTGSWAMTLYGRGRMTRDIDLVVEVDQDDADKIVELFSSDCYVDRDAVRDAVKRRWMFNIIQQQYSIKADFVIRKDVEFRREEFKRRQSVDIEGTQVWIATPEDLILSKLYWSKDSHSETQFKDVCGLISGIQELDWTYLRKWAKELGVGQTLEEAKANA